MMDDRLEMLKEYGGLDQVKAEYDNIFGIHEAMDRTSILMEQINEYVLNHPFILLHQDLYDLTEDIHNKLYSLYQELGKYSLEKE